MSNDVVISSTVVAIQGNPISSEILDSSEDGYIQTWDNSDGYWVARPNNVIKPVFGGYSTSTQTISAGSPNDTQITNWTVKFDNASSFDTGSSNFTAPSTGYYHIDAQMLYSGTLSANAGVWLNVYVDGSPTNDNGLAIVGLDNQIQVSIGTIVYAAVGQTIGLWTGVGGSNDLTIEGAKYSFNYLNIHQL